MPITALERAPQSPQPSVLDDIGANVQALEMQGWVHDRNREDVTRQVANDLTVARQLGEPGEFVVAISQQQVPLNERVLALDGLTKSKFGKRHPETFVDRPLWVPGTKSGSYDDKVLGRLGPEYDGREWVAHGRLILPNPKSTSDPELHHLDKPFDTKYAEEGEETQQEALARQKIEFEARHPYANLNPVPANGVVQWALVRLLKGEPMPLSDGVMRDALAGRTTVVGRLDGWPRATRLAVSWRLAGSER
jgi:hypothetical protein